MDNAGNTAYFEIRVRGQLGATLLGAFPGLRAEIQGTETVLTGVLPDGVALYGVLAEIEALGLELLEVRRPHGWGAARRETCLK
jgi:monoterpene epsilon-lactone hydrolase